MKLNYYEERFERPCKLLHVFVKCFLRILTCFNDFNFSRKVLRISHFRKAYERKLIATTVRLHWSTIKLYISRSRLKIRCFFARNLWTALTCNTNRHKVQRRSLYCVAFNSISTGTDTPLGDGRSEMRTISCNVFSLFYQPKDVWGQYSEMDILVNYTLNSDWCLAR